MGDIKIKIPEEVERDFRRAAMEIYGYSKGSISKAAQKAIEENFRFYSYGDAMLIL